MDWCTKFRYKRNLGKLLGSYTCSLPVSCCNKDIDEILSSEKFSQYSKIDDYMSCSALPLPSKVYNVGCFGHVTREIQYITNLLKVVNFAPALLLVSKIFQRFSRLLYPSKMFTSYFYFQPSRFRASRPWPPWYFRALCSSTYEIVLTMFVFFYGIRSTGNVYFNKMANQEKKSCESLFLFIWILKIVFFARKTQSHPHHRSDSSWNPSETKPDARKTKKIRENIDTQGIVKVAVSPKCFFY